MFLLHLETLHIYLDYIFTYLHIYLDFFNKLSVKQGHT